MSGSDLQIRPLRLREGNNLRMGLFDWYQPVPDICCPDCGGDLALWQSKDGPCVLLVWRQGIEAPVSQLAGDECNLSPQRLSVIRLPDRFVINAECPVDGVRVEAVCTTNDGRWTDGRLLVAEDVDLIFSHRPKAERSAMKRRLDLNRR